MADALNVPLVIALSLVSVTSGIQFRFPEEEVHKGRMDYMRKWRIQGMVQSHPCYGTHAYVNPPIIWLHWNHRMEIWTEEYIRLHKVDYLFLVHPSFRNWPGHQAFILNFFKIESQHHSTIVWLLFCIFSKFLCILNSITVCMCI